MPRHAYANRRLGNPATIAGKLIEALDREVDVACIQETLGCRFFGAKGKIYKLFWIGSKETSDDVLT